MKKLILIAMSLIMVLVIAGCANKAEQTQNAQSPTASTSVNPGGKTLVVYFSMPETTDPNNMTRDEELSTVVVNNEVQGNTEFMAKEIAKDTGADLFRLVPVNPYPTDHQTLIAQAKEEQTNNARPAYEGTVPDLSRYDTIFIGNPNWWGDMPMIMYTFFENNDLSGKTIIPFGTHGGSGFSNIIPTMQRLAPNAKVVRDGLTISRNDIQDAAPAIQKWVMGLGYGK